MKIFLNWLIGTNCNLLTKNDSHKEYFLVQPFYFVGVRCRERKFGSSSREIKAFALSFLQESEEEKRQSLLLLSVDSRRESKVKKESHI